MTDEELLARAKRDREYHKQYNRIRWRAMTKLTKLYPETYKRLVEEMTELEKIEAPEEYEET